MEKPLYTLLPSTPCQNLLLAPPLFSSSLERQPCLQERFQAELGICYLLVCYKLSDLLEREHGPSRDGRPHGVLVHLYQQVITMGLPAVCWEETTDIL